jgi:Methyltransferase domain
MQKLGRLLKRFVPSSSSMATLFPAGHFYSPIVDTGELRARQASVWRSAPTILGIDFNDTYHREVLERFFPAYYGAFDYPSQPDRDPLRFHVDNDQFGWLDCRALFVLLQAWRPKRFIEVGAGFSTLLVADVNRRFLGSAMGITCVEPYPRAFLRSPALGIDRLLVAKVQEVDPAVFAMLEAGDVLFIDSSHVSKTGSDVNHLCFEVLPRLRAGVRVHFHDIFLPMEYPQPWVLDQNRSWNEQYLVRALLMFSTGFRVLFGSSYAFCAHGLSLRKALADPGGACYGGGSLWVERTT